MSLYPAYQTIKSLQSEIRVVETMAAAGKTWDASTNEFRPTYIFRTTYIAGRTQIDRSSSGKGAFMGCVVES
ncbi:MAG: hypothetical protein AAF802_03585 [Planctomycetota bacterium]